MTRKPNLLQSVRQLRDHGRRTALTFDFAGLNYRMTEFQAALGLGQVARFSEIIGKRRSLAETYLHALAGIQGITLPTSNPNHTWQTFFVAAQNQQSARQIRQQLATHGVESGFPSHSAQSLTHFELLPGYSPMPVSQRLSECGITLPLHDRLTKDDIAEICRIFIEITASLMSTGRHERVVLT